MKGLKHHFGLPKKQLGLFWFIIKQTRNYLYDIKQKSLTISWYQTGGTLLVELMIDADLRQQLDHHSTHGEKVVNIVLIFAALPLGSWQYIGDKVLFGSCLQLLVQL